MVNTPNPQAEELIQRFMPMASHLHDAVKITMIEPDGSVINGRSFTKTQRANAIRCAIVVREYVYGPLKGIADINDDEMYQYLTSELQKLTA